LKSPRRRFVNLVIKPRQTKKKSFSLTILRSKINIDFGAFIVKMQKTFSTFSSRVKSLKGECTTLFFLWHFSRYYKENQPAGIPAGKGAGASQHLFSILNRAAASN
jgi:hypothetical protein